MVIEMANSADTRNQTQLYDLGDLKNDPVRLYDMAINFEQFFAGIRPMNAVGEIWDVLEKIYNSLWDSVPPVVVIDLRDPDGSAI